MKVLTSGGSKVGKGGPRFMLSLYKQILFLHMCLRIGLEPIH